jgi:hypothetical protein
MGKGVEYGCSGLPIIVLLAVNAFISALREPVGAFICDIS